MRRLLLALLRRGRRGIEALGADHAQVLLLVETALLLEGRRGVALPMRATPPAGGKEPRPAKEPLRGVDVLTVIHLFLGALLAALFLETASHVTALAAFFAYLMATIALQSISLVSLSFFDPAEAALLAAHPVAPRTLLVARLFHLVASQLVVACAISAGMAVLGTWRIHPAFVLVFAPAVLLVALLTLTSVTLLLVYAARFARTERLRDAVVYLQILLTVALVASLQVLPMILGGSRSSALPATTWTSLISPWWLALPFLLFALKAAGGRALGAWLARWSAVGAGFELTERMLSRDRQLKLRIYPTIGMLFVFPFTLLFVDADGPRAAILHLRQGSLPFVFLYFAALMLPLGLLHLRSTELAGARAIYDSLPLDPPGEMLLGVWLSGFVRLVLFPYLFFAGLMLAFAGLGSLIDVGVVGVVILFGAALSVHALDKIPPFSEKADVAAARAQTRGSAVMALLAMPIILGALHSAVRSDPLSVGIFTVTLLCIAGLLLRRYGRTARLEMG